MNSETVGSDVGKARMYEEAHSLSPIEEESESPGISEMMRFLHEGCGKLPERMTEGNGHVYRVKRDSSVNTRYFEAQEERFDREQQFRGRADRARSLPVEKGRGQL